MQTIRDDHVDNKFVSLYHVGYFINGNGQTLTAGYIYRIFYTFDD